MCRQFRQCERFEECQQDICDCTDEQKDDINHVCECWDCDECDYPEIYPELED